MSFKPRHLAPVVSVALLVTLIAVGGISARAVPGTDEYHARIVTALETVPWSIWYDDRDDLEWYGEDQPVPEVVAQVLKPNAMLQRRYKNKEMPSWSAHLTVVHCADARDLIGHHPPNCYPANGWTEVSGERHDVLGLDGEDLPVRRFEFSKVEHGDERRIDVINFFVLPHEDQQFYREMWAVERASESPGLTGLGAAQFQILTDAGMPEAERVALANEIVRRIRPLIEVIAEGVRHE